MDKKEVIKYFLEKGFLVSPEFLETVDAEKAKKIKTPKNTLVLVPEKHEINVTYKKHNTKETLTLSDFISFYRDRYEKLKNMLVSKIKSPVSVNKAKTETSGVSVICMAKEITARGFIGEDPTGEIEIIGYNEIEEDDVVGVTGRVREGRLFAEEIIYPDVPLNRKINSIDAAVVLGKDIKPDFSPQYITITKDADIVILAFRPETQIKKEEAIKFLKKRSLKVEKNSIKTDKDIYVIEPVPDIFWIISKTKWSEIYKGVLILSGEKIKINLKTKEFSFL